MELIVTGRVIDAAEAREIGLVNEVVPSGTCLERAVELARRSRRCPSRRSGPTSRPPSAAGAGRWRRGCGSRPSASTGSSTGMEILEGVRRFNERDHPDRDPSPAGGDPRACAGAAIPSKTSRRSARLDAMVIAIDGPAGAGKSSVARGVADALGFTYLDSGAMYRCVALAALERGVDLDDPEAMGDLAASLEIELDGDRVLLDGRDVSAAIREPETSAAASRVSIHPASARRWWRGSGG